MSSRFERFALYLTVPAGLLVILLYALPILQVLRFPHRGQRRGRQLHAPLHQPGGGARGADDACRFIEHHAHHDRDRLCDRLGMIHMSAGQRKLALLDGVDPVLGLRPGARLRLDHHPALARACSTAG